MPVTAAHQSASDSSAQSADRLKTFLALFSSPRRTGYAAEYRVPFGKPLPLPEPFGFDLETSDFL
ncbi:hypothetical protein [Streptomyces aidingensis]|uniref:Uncharacterized protein n=1 Tax=Streptomyces aidingensis TaxID=910347 RepID=A0A1I1Q340_9ACTN|nr:hypothetical protein [Streptomyces aidingensis]SFD16459.1 hypothetical protein SAMN05421773_110240 [Streptomyces aidingensis]